MKVITIALIGALAIAACSKSDHSPARAVDSPAPPAAGSAAASTTSDASQVALEPGHPADHRKVIRTGRVALVVAGYDEARGKLDALLGTAGGYVDATRVERRQGAVSEATLTVRIPSAAFAGVLPKLGQIGEVTSETTDAADITDQYVDAEARLASAQQLEKRLLDLATARNGTIDQILAVERELARVRGEIEGYQGHLKQWSDQVALSTLTIEMMTRRAELADGTPPSLGSQSSSAFRASVGALRELSSGLVIALVALGPWLLVFVPAGLLVRKLVRRARQRRIPSAVVKQPAAE